jgi:enoyl-CoA hydratase
MTDCFDVTIEDHVAHISLCRPDVFNTMVPEFWNDLPRIVRDIDEHAKARVIVLSSTGKHFCAGMDLAVFAGEGLTEGGVQEQGRKRAHLWMLVQKLQDSFTAFEQARMPVLAAVQGGCIGGAVDMVTAADLRYCTEDAFFCVQEINLGMTADVGTLQRLPKLIPEGIAREYAYTGARMPASEALQYGLVNRVFPDHASLLEGVMGVARQIATRSPLAIWGTKEMVNFTRDHSVADSLRYMAGWQSGMFQPGDMVEEMVAKGERRDPSFEELPTRPTGLGG